MCVLLTINLYVFTLFEVILYFIMVFLDYLEANMHSKLKRIPAFMTVLSVPVNHKCGDCDMFVSVMYHYQNPLEFVNG